MAALNDATRLLPRLVLLTGHGTSIDSLAFSPDGRTLATGSRDGTVILWDLPTGSIRARFPGDGWNLRLAFSPDGATLATVDREIRLWETATGRWLGTLPGYLPPLGFASLSQLVVGSPTGDLVRLDPESGSVLQRLAPPPHDPPYRETLLSPDASLAVMVLSNNSELRVRDLESGELYPSPKVQTYRGCFAVCPSNHLVAIGRWSTVVVGDLRTGKQTQGIGVATEAVYSVAFCPRGDRLAAGTDWGEVKLWDLASGQEILSIAAHSYWVLEVAFSPDGQRIASASHDTTVKIWDLRTGRCQQSLPGRAKEALCVSFSPDGRTFASGHADGTARLWDAATGQLLRTLRCRHPEVSSLSFADEGRTLVCGSFKLFCLEIPGAIELWDLGTGARLQEWETDICGIESLSVSARGQLVVASCNWTGEEETYVWSRDSGELCCQMRGHAATFSPDGTRLAAARSVDGIGLWETRSWTKVRDVDTATDYVAALCFSPDGRTLLAGLYAPDARTLRAGMDEYEVGLWSVATGEPLWKAPAHTEFVSVLAFSPDGRLAAIGGADASEIRLWRLQPQAREVRTLKGHEGHARAVSFHPAGHQLLTASGDGTLKLWDVLEGSLLVTFQVLPSSDGSTSEDWITYTPSGHYFGSPGAERFANWQLGEKLLPAEAFRDEFCQPDWVAEALQPAQPGGFGKDLV